MPSDSGTGLPSRERPVGSGSSMRVPAMRFLKTRMMSSKYKPGTRVGLPSPHTGAPQTIPTVSERAERPVLERAPLKRPRDDDSAPTLAVEEAHTGKPEPPSLVPPKK